MATAAADHGGAARRKTTAVRLLCCSGIVAVPCASLSEWPVSAESIVYQSLTAQQLRAPPKVICSLEVLVLQQPLTDEACGKLARTHLQSFQWTSEMDGDQGSKLRTLSATGTGPA